MPISKKTLDRYFAELRRIEEHRTAGAEKKIRRLYKALMKELIGFLGNEYAQYADSDGNLSIALLQSQSRYARFLEEVEKQVDGLSPKYAKLILDTVEETYKSCYDGMVEAVQKSNSDAELAAKLQGLSVRPEVMKNAVDNPVSGLTLPDVLEKHRAEVIYGIKQELNMALVTGDRYETVAKKLSNRLDIDYRKAITIARTETHRVQEGGFMDCAVDLQQCFDGSNYIYAATWRTMKDERVRPQVAAYKRKAGVKARKKYTAGRRSYFGKPNHVTMEGRTVKAGDYFKFDDGVKTKAPSHSGVAGHDCNCRCFLEYNLMTFAEFEKATGKPVNTTSVRGSIKQQMNNNGIANLELQRTTDTVAFDKAIREMKKQGGAAACVDTHPLEELNDFKLFLSENQMAGVAVKPDGDITAVFKNAEYKVKGGVNDLIITARANGGEKMDCYGSFLANSYEKCGYVPVARIPFNADYVDDPYLLKTRPDVYVMMKNTDDLQTVIEKNAKKAYKVSTQEELDKLKTIEDYDEALSYRDQLLKAQEGK